METDVRHTHIHIIDVKNSPLEREIDIKMVLGYNFDPEELLERFNKLRESLTG